MERAQHLSATDPQSPRSVQLWVGALVPPLAWAVHLVAGDVIFELGCSRGNVGHMIAGLPLKAWSVAQSALLAAVCVVAGLMAAKAWRTLRERTDGTSLDRAHAMAIVGMAHAGIFALIIVYDLVAMVILHACEYSLWPVPIR